MRTGIDIIEISRIRDILKRHGQRFLDRIFTADEQAYCLRQSDPAPHLAARWAAKEAFIKACGPRPWLDMEVVRDADGAPSMQGVALSITHSREYAAAIVIMEN